MELPMIYALSGQMFFTMLANRKPFQPLCLCLFVRPERDQTAELGEVEGLFGLASQIIGGLSEMALLPFVLFLFFHERFDVGKYNRTQNEN